MKNQTFLRFRTLTGLLWLGASLNLPAQVPQLLHYQGRAIVANTNFEGTGQFKFALVSPPQEVSRQATATATIIPLPVGQIAAILVNNVGAGYTSIPAVTISGGGGSGGAATASLSSGHVTSIILNNPGQGYTSPPTVTIDPPPSHVVTTSFWSNDGTSLDGSEPTAAVSLPVSKGLYAVLLGDTNLPNMTAITPEAFANADVRLRVWFNGGPGFQLVSPDQRIAAVGYSMVAASVPDGAITAAKLAPDAVGAANVQDGSLTAGKLAASQVVKTLNSLTDNVNLIGVGNVSVTPSGNTLQISTIGTLIIENRTSDPPSPAIGQLWLRTDQ